MCLLLLPVPTSCTMSCTRIGAIFHLPSSEQSSSTSTCSVAKSYLTFYDPTDCSPQGSSDLGIFQAKYRSGVACPPPGDHPDPGMKSASPVFPLLAGGSSTAEPPGNSTHPLIHAIYLFQIILVIKILCFINAMYVPNKPTSVPSKHVWVPSFCVCFSSGCTARGQ